MLNGETCNKIVNRLENKFIIRSPILDLFIARKWLKLNFSVKYHIKQFGNEVFSLSHNELHNLRSNAQTDLVLKTVHHINDFKDSFFQF
jgi:hypothetical protein